MDGKDSGVINAGASTSGLQQSQVSLSKKIFLSKNFAFIEFCKDFVITRLIFSSQVDESSVTGLDRRRSDEPQPSTSGLQRQSSVS